MPENTMKVEILLDFKDSGNNYITGETRVVEWNLGEYFCRAGWAKDLSGVVSTGSPGKHDVVLKVDNLKLASIAETVNG